MHFAPILALALATASTAIATQWTIKDMARTCNADVTICNYQFAIDTNDGAPLSECAYSVAGSPATQAPVIPEAVLKCGPFVLTQKWNGQFGPGNGFTTWQCVDYGKQIEAFPSYEDWALVNGTAVKPDRSFTVQPLV
jgi:hypothetical protein